MSERVSNFVSSREWRESGKRERDKNPAESGCGENKVIGKYTNSS